MKRYKVIRGKNPDFLYDVDVAKFKTLRIKENLDLILDETKTEMEKIILLNDWAHHQIYKAYYGTTQINLPENPSLYIDMLRSKVVKGLCGNFSYLFIQACLSVDILARSIHLENSRGYGHDIADAWDKEERRWILVDPSFNIMYYKMPQKDVRKFTTTDTLSPLNILELHNLSLIKLPENKLLIYHPMFGYTGVSSQFKRWIIRYFRKFYIRMRNDILSNEKWLEWKDGESKIEEFLWEES